MQRAARPETPDVRIAVVGAGGIGGFVGGLLSLQQGVETTWCVRRPFRVMTISTPASGDVRCRGAVVTEPSAAAPVDWVLLAVKSHQTAAVTPWLQHLCGPATRVVVLQNGVEHEERVLAAWPSARVVPAVVRYGVEALEPGHVRLTLVEDVVVPDSADGRAFSGLCAGTDLRVALEQEWGCLIWTKLASNVVGNSLTALLDLPVHRLGRLLQRPRFGRIGEALVSEVRAVAASVEVDLAPDTWTRLAERFRSADVTVTSSMHQDRTRGRHLEHDALVGAVVRIGRRSGVPTPTCSMVLEALEEVSQGQAER